MNIDRKSQRLKLGKIYNVQYGSGYSTECVFIQVTRCGFNLLDTKNSKCILNRHLYISKHPNHSSGEIYWINKNLYINEKIL